MGILIMKQYLRAIILCLSTLMQSLSPVNLTFEELEHNHPWFPWVFGNRSEYFNKCGVQNNIDPHLLRELADWYKEQYDRTIATMTRTYKPVIIPKKIHFIWFGPPIPARRSYMMDSWEQIHYNWQIYKWDEASIKSNFPGGLENQAVFDQAMKIKNYAKASDVARYEILKKYGGLYIDSDVICLQSMMPFHENFSFYAGIEFFSGTIIGNAIIGSTSNHPILTTCIEMIKDAHPANYVALYDAMPELMADWPLQSPNNDPQIHKEEVYTIITTGPALLTRAVCSFVHTKDQHTEMLKDICIAPSTYFYPDYESKCTGSRKTYCCHYAIRDWRRHITLTPEQHDEKHSTP